jgi:hypothetical protein
MASEAKIRSRLHKLLSEMAGRLTIFVDNGAPSGAALLTCKNGSASIPVGAEPFASLANVLGKLLESPTAIQQRNCARRPYGRSSRS